MHHPEVEIQLLVRVRFLKNPEEVVAHLTHLKEFFNFIIGHFILICGDHQKHPAGTLSCMVAM